MWFLYLMQKCAKGVMKHGWWYMHVLDVLSSVCRGQVQGQESSLHHDILCFFGTAFPSDVTSQLLSRERGGASDTKNPDPYYSHLLHKQTKYVHLPRYVQGQGQCNFAFERIYTSTAYSKFAPG